MLGSDYAQLLIVCSITASASANTAKGSRLCSSHRIPADGESRLRHIWPVRLNQTVKRRGPAKTGVVILSMPAASQTLGQSRRSSGFCAVGGDCRRMTCVPASESWIIQNWKHTIIVKLSQMTVNWVACWLITELPPYPSTQCRSLTVLKRILKTDRKSASICQVASISILPPVRGSQCLHGRQVELRMSCVR